jgi:hypothetical protein
LLQTSVSQPDHFGGILVINDFVRAIHESPVPENGRWAGRFVNRPYNFVADPIFVTNY